MTAPVSPTAAAKPAGAAVRVCQPEDRRRIADCLDEKYDISAKRYKGAGTDHMIGEQLKMPRAWVTEVREMFYGPEANEAAAERDAVIDRLLGRLSELETCGLEYMQKHDSLKREIEKLRR